MSPATVKAFSVLEKAGLATDNAAGLAARAVIADIGLEPEYTVFKDYRAQYVPAKEDPAYNARQSAWKRMSAAAAALGCSPAGHVTGSNPSLSN